MKKMITYQRMDPAGNITAFVFTPTPEYERVVIGRALMDQVDQSVEQVGFITMNDRGEPLRLDMMGGEFCGNASRALGLLQAIAKNREGKVIEKVHVSGVSHPLTVHVDTRSSYAKIALPKPDALFSVLLEGRSYTAVQLPGILHVLVPDREEDEAFVHRALCSLEEQYPAEAYGLLFLQESRKSMIPYVYVTEAKTLYREGSCGSGSYAVGVARKDAWHLREKPVLLQQPRGVIELSLEKVGAEEEVMIGGKVGMEAPRRVEIDLPL
ncbi:hypothetical protein [Murdochiella massiliensis]|uniref:hypothetical protein n=1 Tax=Murdochiella massiliensis TaxID=1673723 RepID=UPI00082E8113|nr:hypothetical protein [Murdochiella massiliensis]MBY0584237.1 hypothetical protein [Murdochiella sp. Marseille-P8839]